MKAWKLVFSFSFILIRKFSLLFKRRSKSLVIVKIDAIGDYILFRNFFSDIRNSDRYKGFTITLIGNILWKDLYEELDRNLADHVIWIDHRKYSASLSDRRKFLSSITDRKYSELIVFHFSRTFTPELLAFAISAKKKIGFDGDRTYLRSGFTDRFYTQLIGIPDDNVHEFSKNSFFTSIVLGEKISRYVPSMELLSTKDLIHKDSIVVAPGAGVAQRQLPLERWIKMMKQLLDNNEKICLVGSKSEQPLAAILIEAMNGHSNILDLTGKTSLAEIPYIIASGKMTICNETSTYHFAVSLKKMVVCFAGGGHFRRFASYDESPLIKLVYHSMECFNCNWNCIYPEQAKATYPCISSIEEHIAKKAIAEALKEVS